MTGEEELELRCGEASISLKKDGKLVIRGAYVETHARGRTGSRAARSRSTEAMRRVEVEPLWDVVEEHLDEAEFLWGCGGTV
ncbi:hypothetical protein [Nannocystis pusilla]|uniref:hypothetical protein n=1 Tax=Nannocystis pusilla TaxID=889268 RepID=UPI003B7DBD45